MRIKLSTIFIVLTYLAVCLRWLLDRADFGILGAMLVVGLFLALIVLKQKLPFKFVLLFLGISLLLALSWLQVIKFQGITIYPLKPIIRYLSYLMIFYLFYSLPFSFKSFLRVYGFLIGVQFAVAIFEFVILNDDRPNGTLQNNNHIMYVLAIFFAINLFYFRKKLASVFLVSFATFLRGLGGIVTIISMFVSFLLLGKGKTLTKIGYLFIGALLIPVIVIIYSNRIRENQGIFELEQRIETEQAGAGGGSLVWRIVTWSMHINYVKQNKASLLGLGIDTSSSVSPYSTPVSRHDPHGDYTLLFVDFGLVGLSIYVIALVSTIILYYRKFRKSKDHRHLAIALMCIGLLSGHTVGNLLTQSTLWWMIAGFFGMYLRNLRNDPFEVIANN